MTRLSQIVAIEKGVKSQTTRVETDLYHALDKKPLFSGLARTYTPKDEEDGDRLPPEQVSVQLKSEDVVNGLTSAVTRLIDVTATKDAANTRANADVVVDGTVIAASVPVTTLMFLEKELEKLSAFVGRLPQLDPTQDWTYDPNRGVFSAAPMETVRTKKIPRNHVLYEATKEHPAQVQVYNEDVIVGTWKKQEYSGALPADRIVAISSRLEKLRTAVKFAREEANTIEVTDVHYGANILGFLFNGPTAS
jgi:hypothetical protein